MDDQRFDALARWLGGKTTRRTALGGIAGLAGAGLGEALGKKRRGGNGADVGSIAPQGASCANVCVTCTTTPAKGANLTKCNLVDADLPNKDLRGINLTSACVTEADLSGSNLSGMIGRGVCLNNTNLARANLRAAQLTNANLCGADLTGADLRGAIVTTAQIACATVDCSTILPNGKPAVPCPTGQTCCSGVCKALKTDPENCGTCGKACAPGGICRNGFCTCPTPCTGATPYCVNGACVACRTTNDCSGDDVCTNGICCGSWKWSVNFGTQGSGTGEFESPTGISVFPYAGTIVAAVTDGALIATSNNRVAFWGRTSGVWNQDEEYCPAGADALITPYDVHVSLVYGIHILDTGNNRVEVVDQDFNVVTTYGSYGTGDGQFTAPRGVAVDEKSGYAYVADHDNNRVSVWKPNLATTSYDFVDDFGTAGSGPSNLSQPYDVAIGPDGLIYVADAGNSRISIWKRSTTDTFSNVGTFGSNGTGPTNFDQPFGVHVATDGRVFVADTTNQRFSIWKKKGANWVNQATYGSVGSGDGEFAFPFKIVQAVFRGKDMTWVVDTGNNRVQVWQYDPSCPPPGAGRSADGKGSQPSRKGRRNRAKNGKATS